MSDCPTVWLLCELKFVKGKYLPLAFSVGSPKSVTQADTKTKPRTACFSAYLHIDHCFCDYENSEIDE